MAGRTSTILTDGIPERPLSGVANCHAEGVYSFVFSDTLRMFACLNWTGLSANDYGDVVGFHDHHRNLDLEVAFGEIENIDFKVLYVDNGTAPYTKWQWDSSLRGGLGRFTQTEGMDTWCRKREFITMTQKSGPFHLVSTDFHTVKQTTKKVGWFVREDPTVVRSRTWNYSRHDLTSWHDTADYYRPLDEDELIEVWNEVRGLSINARKRNGRI